LDSAVKWLHNGAQPTDTAKAILSYKGALLKHHLDGGIRKGALTQEQADAKLAAWLEAKAGKVDAKKEGLTKAQANAKAKAFKAEQAVNAKRLADAAQAEADAIAAANPVEEVEEEVTQVVEDTVVDEAPVTEVEVETAPEVVAEEVVVAEVEATPEVVAEVEVETAPEVVAEVEATPEVVAEVAETPAADEATEETPEA
jgi:small subunit ribosomal protein S16